MASGTLSIEDWSVTRGSGTDVPVTSVRLGEHSGAAGMPQESIALTADNANMIVTLVHDGLPDTGTRPTVSYDGTGGLAPAGAAPLAEDTARAADGVPPTILGSRFAGSEAFLIAFSEPIVAPATMSTATPLASEQSPLAVQPTADAPLSTVRLNLHASVRPSAAQSNFAVGVPATVADVAGNAITRVEPSFNPFPDEHAVVLVPRYAPGTYVSGAASDSTTRTVVEFGDSQPFWRGTTFANQWSVWEIVDGVPVERDVTGIAIGNPASLPAASTAQSAAVTITDREFPAAQRNVVLWHDAFSTTAPDAEVRYGGGSRSQDHLRTASGLAAFEFVPGQGELGDAVYLPATSVPHPRTSDEVLPLFGAVTNSASQMTLTFTEPVSGTTVAGDWTVEGATVVGPVAAALDGDTTLVLEYVGNLDTGAGPLVTYTGAGMRAAGP